MYIYIYNDIIYMYLRLLVHWLYMPILHNMSNQEKILKCNYI
jgi:hypothetical protein